MSLAEAIRGAVAAAQAATASFQEEVSLETYLGPADAYGQASYGWVVSYAALVDRTAGTIRDDRGVDVQYRVAVSFLDQVAVTPQDRITLADGTTGPIITPQGGLVDPVSGEPFCRTVYLG